MPLKADGRTVGVIAVQTYREDRRYAREDLDLLVFVAQHVGSALVRARAIEETRQRNAELAIVNEIGAALAKQLDFEEIVELVGERVRDIFEASSLFIALYDEATETIRFPYEIAEGERLHTRPDRARRRIDLAGDPVPVPASPRHERRIRGRRRSPG